jgi:hypothetical protein
MKANIRKMPLPAKSISLGGERMRRHRQRRRDGLRSVRIELRETEVDALIRSGFLEGRSRNDGSAVAQALYRLFDRVFRVTRNVSTSS